MSVEITVVDDRVDPGDWHQFTRYAGWAAAATRVGEVTMNSAKSMVDNVIDAADGSRIHWLNILDHGSANGIQLGSDYISLNTASKYKETLERLREHFTNNATVHLQHCKAGRNEELMKWLAGLWGVKVRAGKGNHNPILRANYSFDPYVICNAEKCWDDVPKATPNAANWSGYKMCCFPGGTPVITPHGEVAIERIQTGDRVVAWDRDHRRAVPVVVEAVEEHEGRFPLQQLEFGPGASLEVAGGHRFASSSGFWKPSTSLRPGESVTGLDRTLSISTINDRPPAACVFNLRTRRFGNYHVGPAGLRVRDH